MHTCSTLILTCIDFRFQTSINDWLVQQGLIGDCDRVAIAGGVLNFVNPAKAEYQELLLKQIEIAQNLHHIKKVILINHEDCGAYGGKSSFENDNAEKHAHTEDVKKAIALITVKFTELIVEGYLAKLDGEVEKIQNDF